MIVGPISTWHRLTHVLLSLGQSQIKNTVLKKAKFESSKKRGISWSVIGLVLPAEQGEELSHSALGGLTSSTVCRFGCHNIRRT